MTRIFLTLLMVGSLLATSKVSLTLAQEPDATVKITRRSVSEAVGLSWGDGVLTYKGKEYTFTFQASGLLREIDPSITTAELSGQVFNLKNLEDFNGNYKIVKASGASDSGGGFAEMKNENGVVVHMVTITGGHKFTLGAAGMTMELKK